MVSLESGSLESGPSKSGPSESPTRELSLEEAVSVAILLQKNRQFVAAREVYRRVLEMAPDHPRALHYAGLLAHQQGRNEEALALIERSIALVPDQADWHSNLGIVLQSDQRLDSAIASYRRTIKIDPADNRVRLQRSFIPFEPKKRLYGINVGSPTGTNYSYDLETGTVLRAWRGGFLDAWELWHERAENQLAIPTGPATGGTAKATVDLPQPDSPTRPSASPCSRLKEMPGTTLISPARVK